MRLYFSIGGKRKKCDDSIFVQRFAAMLTELTVVSAKILSAMRAAVEHDLKDDQSKAEKYHNQNANLGF